MGNKRLLILLTFSFIIFGLLFRHINIYGNSKKINISENCQKLIASKIDDEEYNLEYLYDIKLDSTYLLIQNDNFYMIYDIICDTYMEYAYNKCYPYQNLLNNEKKVYVGPSIYLYSHDNFIYDASTKKIVDSNQLTSYYRIETEYRSKLKKARGINSINSSALIPHSWYFINLLSNYGSNTSTLFEGSCGYVSIESILSYYDTFYSDNIIAETYDVTVSKSFSNYASIYMENYPSSPGINDTFHSHLIDLGRTYGYTNPLENSLNFYLIDDFLDSYYSASTISLTYTYYSGDEVYDDIIDCIDEGKPVIIRIENGVDSYHSVVGFGYVDEGIFVHTGWKAPENTFLIINSNIIKNALKISITSPTIVHSNNYKWSVGVCQGHIRGNGTKVCYHDLTYLGTYDIAGHDMYCSCCNNNVVEAHTFVPQGLGYICSVCGYYTRWPIIINVIEEDI